MVCKLPIASIYAARSTGRLARDLLYHNNQIFQSQPVA